MSGNYVITMLPNSTSDLTSLKAFLIKDCRKLKKMPYLRKMNALRELNLSGTAMEELFQGLGNLHIREPMLNSRGSQGETLLTNEMVGDAFIENPEMVLNRMEDRQVLPMPIGPSPSQTPPSPPPLVEFLKYVVPTMLVFLAIQYAAKSKALFGKHWMPLGCFFATTIIYWLTVGVMKQMSLTTEARKMRYLVLSRIALVSGIQSVLFLLSMFMNHVPPTIISLFISAPIALVIAYFFIKMVFGDGDRNSTGQPVRSAV